MPYTDEELRECLRQLADTLGEPPTQKQCQSAETTPSARTYHNRFGSWNDALEAAGLPINKENPSYTDAELIAALREFAGRVGETPTHTQVNEDPEIPYSKAYCDRFGSWNTALEVAGLDVNNESSFTDEDLLSRLQELAAELGQTPSKTEINSRDEPPSATTYERRFGSWNDALRAAGLAVNHEQERYEGTDKELLDMLRELTAELDTSPTFADVNVAPDLPSADVFRNRFGGWNAAKREAGLETTDQPDQYTDAELRQELRRVSQTVEKPLTSTDMKEADAPSVSTYCRRFESWTAAKEQAGLMDTQEPPTQ